MELLLFQINVILAILLVLYISRSIFNGLVYLNYSLLMVAIVGYDPVTILTPIIFIIGLFSQHIYIRYLKFPLLLKIYIFIFLLFTLLSCCWSPVWNWVIRFWSGVIFFYFTNLFITSVGLARKMFFSIILGTIISSFIALSTLVFDLQLGSLFFPVFTSFRFAGLYNTTILGIFSAILIIWIIDELLHPKLWEGGIILKFCLLALYCLQMLSTLTRSAWLGFAVAFSIYLILELNKINVMRKASIIGILLLLVTVASMLITNLDSAETIRKRITVDTFDLTEGEEKRAKFYFTRNALEVAFQHPFGVGIGNTQKMTETFNGLEVGAHNNLVMVMSDMGWFAFIGFFLLQFYILWKLLVKALCSKVKYGLSAQMLFCCNIILFISGMYQDLLLYIPMWLIPSLSTIVLFPDHYRKLGSFIQSNGSRVVQCEVI